MNVDEFRSALHEPAPVLLLVDLDRVVARGRRRRAVRRAAVPVVAVATAAAIAVPVTLLSNGPAEVETARRPTPTATPPVPPPPTAVATATPPAPVPVGAVVDTGDRIEGGTRAFVLHPVAEGRYVLRMDARSPAGELETRYGRSTQLSAASPPGFRVVSLGGAAADDWVLFGAYIGPAARVTAVLGGRPATARLGHPAGLPGLTVFWFSAGTGAPEPADATEVSDLRAYDAAGNRLPAGNTGIGRG